MRSECGALCSTAGALREEEETTDLSLLGSTEERLWENHPEGACLQAGKKGLTRDERGWHLVLTLRSPQT